jgi:hypothetical protein
MSQLQALMILSSLLPWAARWCIMPGSGVDRRRPQEWTKTQDPVNAQGSCKGVADSTVARASSAIVQLRADGTTSCLVADVPGDLPQSAVMAEHLVLALLVAACIPNAEVTECSNCQAMVSDIAALAPQVHSLKAKFGAHWQEAQDHTECATKSRQPT